MLRGGIPGILTTVVRSLTGSTSVNVARLLFLVVCEIAGVVVALTSESIEIWVGFLGGLVVAGFFIFVETLTKGFTLRGFSTATFGLLVGLFCAWLLKQLNLDQLLITLFDLQAGDAEALSLSVNAGLFGSLGFLGAVLALRSGQDEFAFIIPYVRFRQDAASGQPLLLDADVIMDGRVPRVLASGFLTGRLIVPSFVLEELQFMASSPTSGKRQRGQRGLDCLEEMQGSRNISITIHETPSEPASDSMDQRLIQTARMLGARLLTTDQKLTKVARLQSAEVLNIDDLADALKPAVVVGEKIHLALVRAGKDEHQGVGYLPDGTMIVVNNAVAKVGTTQDVLVISTLQTAGGLMVFAELYDESEGKG